MDYINMIIQAIVQGLTEFLPVSSSGHLSVLQHFLDIKEGSLTISVVLHLGTLIAVFIAFRRDILGMIKEFVFSLRDICTGKFSWKDMNESRRMMIMVIISTLLLIPVYFLRWYFTAPEGDGDIIFEGIAFLFTALILFFSDAAVKGRKTGRDITVRDALTVGFFQVVAVLPGVSRSGSTISAGLFRGFERRTAVTYAFILGIPAILGGSVTELSDALHEGAALNIPLLLLGMVIAAVVGLLSIKLVQIVIKHDKFKIFAVYTLIIGILCVIIGAYENISWQSFVDR